MTKSGKRRAGLVAHMAEKKYTSVHRFTAAHPGRRRKLGIFRSRWEDNIKVDIERMEEK
jgi:hypothetical protein